MLIYFTPVTNFPVFYSPKLQDYLNRKVFMSTTVTTTPWKPKKFEFFSEKFKIDKIEFYP